MKLLSKAVTTVIAVISLVSGAYAGSYTVTNLSYIYSEENGRVLIKWSGSPNPGPCGANNGWVTIRPTANESLKTLAYTIYFSGKPARIDTSGCDGRWEVVTSLYSPGG